MKRHLLIRLSLFLCAWFAVGSTGSLRFTSAQTERPGDVRRVGVYAITNARIVPVVGQPVERGAVVIRDGLIAAVGAAVQPPSDARIIDGTGLTVYPGVADANANIGFAPASPAAGPTPGGTPPARPAGGAPNSTRPVGVQPEALAADLIRPNGDGVEAARTAGVTSALAIPRDGLLIGRSAFINLSGATPQEMVLRSPVALHIAFAVPPGFGSYPSSLMGVFSLLRQMFSDAQRYRDAESAYRQNPRGVQRPDADPALAALVPALNREIPVVMYADTEREMLRALDLAQEFGLRPIIAGGREATKVSARLRSARAAVLLSLNFPKRTTAAAPEADPEPLSVLRARVAALKTAAALAAADVPFAFQSGGAPYGEFFANAAKTVENGLSRDAALQAMTIRPAELFNVADRLGSIETGKIANLTVTRGDLLDPKSKLAFVFIDGKMMDVRPGGAPPGELAGMWTQRDGGKLALNFTKDGGETRGELKDGQETRAIADLRLGIAEDASLSTVQFTAREGAATFVGVYTADEIRGAFVVAGKSEPEMIFRRAAPPAGTSPNAGPKVNLSGAWRLNVSFNGQTVPVTLTLRQEGDRLTGDIATPFGNAPLTDGGVTGTSFRCAAALNVGGQSLALSVVGSVAGDRMEGTISSSQGDAGFTGTRPQEQ
jgi:imidazolonepropionase-like amidohydrolase